MAHKSVAGFRPKRIRDRRFYTDDDIGRIIKAAGGLPPGNVLPDGDVDLSIYDLDGNALGLPRDDRLVDRRTELGCRLELAAQNWDVKRQLQKRPTHRQRARAFARIETDATRLLTALSVPEDGDTEAMPPALLYGGLQAYAAKEAETHGQFSRYTGKGLLDESIKGVARLHRWAAAARKRAEALIPRDGPGGHTGDKALNTLFGDLAGIWLDIFERTPATALNATGQPGGPFLRFLRASLDPLPVTMTDEAIRDRARRLFQGKPRRPGKSKRKKI